MHHAAALAVFSALTGAAQAAQQDGAPSPVPAAPPISVAVPGLSGAPAPAGSRRVGPPADKPIMLSEPAGPSAARVDAFAPYVRAGLGTAPRDLDGAGHLFAEDDAVAYRLSAGAARPAGPGRLGAEVAYLGARDLDVAREGDVEVRFKGPKVQVTYAFSF